MNRDDGSHGSPHPIASLRRIEISSGIRVPPMFMRFIGARTSEPGFSR
ncbi:MAG: hypothetical protein ACREP7_16770 [Lysobacter sp.]